MNRSDFEPCGAIEPEVTEQTEDISMDQKVEDSFEIVTSSEIAAESADTFEVITPVDDDACDSTSGLFQISKQWVTQSLVEILRI